MTASRRSHREWRLFLRISVTIALVSSCYGIAIRQPDSSIAMAIVVSVVTSLIVGTPLVLVELNRDRMPLLRNLRHLPLAAFFAVKVAFYVVVIVAGLFLSRVVMQPLTGDKLDFDDVFRTSIVFSIVMSVAFNVVFEIGGLLGFRTVKNLFTGRYVKPRREQRAF